MRTMLAVMISCLLAAEAFAHCTYTARSGAPGLSTTCASSCHGSPGGTMTVTGFPASYTPGQSYLLTISRASGNVIQNFNASCRVGTGSVNAGVIAAGTNTSTYNVTNETNGVHFTSCGQTTGTFNWTAPAAGTGTVRLYAAGLQSTGSSDGLNTELVLVSNEAASLPGQATNPSPANNATGVAATVAVSWTAGSGATSHDVNFGTTNPPAFIGNQAGTSYDPPGSLAANTVYYWRIDERNASGATTGTVWQFTTAIALPGPATNPSPANNATDVALNATLSWTAGSNATSHDVRFGTTNPPALIGNQAGTSYDPGALTASTVYYWRIDERNSSGVTTGTVWHFTTQSAPPPLPGAATNPSPANNAVEVALNATLSWTAGSDAATHDVNFGTANPPPMIGNQSGTTYNPGALSATTTYYWRIDERNASGVTPGTVWQFTTRAPLPGGVSNPSPADGATQVPTSTTLSWTGHTGSTYNVYLGRTTPPPQVSQEQAGTEYLPAHGLRANKLYYWRVDEVTADGVVQGPLWTFRTQRRSHQLLDDKLDEAESSAVAAELGEAYPNPFNATVSVPFKLREAAQVRLVIYDVTGREVALLADGYYEAGAHQVQWSSQGVSTGTYLIRFTAAGQTMDTRITVLK